MILKFTLFLTLGMLWSCKSSIDEEPQFIVHQGSHTGLDFINHVTPKAEFNALYYMYFYNGGGVGAGDFNNDGLIDLFFTSNMEDNKLFLNQGGLKFQDITDKANIPNPKGWTTGVSVIDINNDGLLDIYVSCVGKYREITGHNQLLVCTGISAEGIPSYEDRAAEYGIDIVGFCTQAAFLDYDMDGDLDMMQMKHSLHQNGTFGQRKAFLNTYDTLAGDQFFRNDNGKFVDVTKETGIHSNVIGYGLGLAVGDINLDGYPDMYVGNDFHENDYLYLNQKDGTFRDVLTEQINHTSRFSMGVDIGDLDNDAHSEIMSLDMLPYDPYILKRSEGEDANGIFRFKLTYGYNHQYARNNLQYNNKNSTFSEIGLYSDVFASDWSWSAIFADFDFDGLKDIFVSNGIPKRMNDIDYINFMENNDAKFKGQTFNLDKSDLTVLEHMPEIKLENKIYKNQGNLKFQDIKTAIEDDKASYSSGSIVADLDNDGDLDIVVNNMDDYPYIYENVLSPERIQQNSLQIELKGIGQNPNALGTKLLVYMGKEIILYEHQSTKGFQSSVVQHPIVGLNGSIDKVDSLIVIWPDNTYQILGKGQINQKISLQYTAGLPTYDYNKLHSTKQTPTKIQDITEQSKLDYIHVENQFVEFDREPLIPFSTSSEGPALAVGDVNGDGLEDVFLGSGKRERSALYFQTPQGTFTQQSNAYFSQDSTYEEVDAIFEDINQDGYKDLVIANGGNEFSGKSPYLLPQAFLNNGKGQFQVQANAFMGIYITASCVLPYDFTGDGVVDLFIGGRAVPREYGSSPRSYLLQNDGRGNFTDVTDQYSESLMYPGFVKNGEWTDMDQDGDKDLVLALEWGVITIYSNEGKNFQKKEIGNEKGLWNMVHTVDVDNDGDLDILAGNLGLNSRLKASIEQPIRMYHNDFDDNGVKEQVLTYYLDGQELPFSNMMELQKQLPILKKKYLKAHDFALANLQEIFGSEKLNSSKIYEANTMESMIYLNDGKGNFKAYALPFKAQWTSNYAAHDLDVNSDGLLDIMILGNYYDCNIQMGRYDADFGSLLINKGDGNFDVQSIPNIRIDGQVKNIKSIKIGNQNGLIVAKNNAAVQLLTIN